MLRSKSFKIMTKLKCSLAIAMIALTTFSLYAKKYEYDYLYKNLPFEMPKVQKPKFPKHVVSIEDFGAVGNGKSLCTEAFAKAIDAVAAKGGGTVNVPVGVWFTGPIVFKSNINLTLLVNLFKLFQ